MLRKRIIFSLIYCDGYFSQSRNFRLQRVGDLNWLEKNYKFQNIAFSLDELIVLNASKGEKRMDEFALEISNLVHNVFIPISAGGGIKNLKDAELLFNSGADKIVLNSAFYEAPALINELVKIYGAQSVIASIDYKTNNGVNEVYINDGQIKLDISLDKYIQHIESLNIGEIYLNSIDKDGTGFGYDFEVIRSLEGILSKPLIIAGGAGNEKHLIEGLKIAEVSAVATANLFNFIGDGIPNARSKILEEGINIVDWNTSNIKF